jgi:SAM-dependent methyltransferase
MATMPATSPNGQPEVSSDRPDHWFRGAAGQALLHSESKALHAELQARHGLPWLWLAPVEPAAPPAGRASAPGLRLQAAGAAWNGDLRCALPLPLAGECVGTVVLQHVLVRQDAGRELLAECARVLVPGGRLVLLALNPLAPYRLRWRGSGLQASEPLAWRRRLREAGLVPEPLSQGIGPGWRVEVASALQHGVGLRAAYLLRAEKRAFPLTPLRQRRPVAARRTAPVT